MDSQVNQCHDKQERILHPVMELTSLSTNTSQFMREKSRTFVSYPMQKYRINFAKNEC